MLKKVRSQLSDTKNEDTAVVVDLMELSDEMAELRLMVSFVSLLLFPPLFIIDLLYMMHSSMLSFLYLYINIYMLMS